MRCWPVRSPPDLSNRAVAGLRVGVPKSTVLENRDTPVATHCERSLALLAGAGAQLEHIDVPEFAQDQ